MLTPTERHRVDAVGEGLYATLHRDSIHDVARDIREHRAAAMLVSVARINPAVTTHMAAVVRQFPGIPALALLTHLEYSTPYSVLSLGRSGIQQLIDARSPGGWRRLRDALAPNRHSDFARYALGRLVADVPDASPGWVAFLELLFAGPTTLTSVNALARALDTQPNAFATRFYRARLPSPRLYLTNARLTRAAHLLESPGLTLTTVAHSLDFSSPQSLGRSIQTTLTMTPTTFRHTFDGPRMLDRFRHDLVHPFRHTIPRFEPLP
jgi:AraC-like DNA-binding protein